MIQLTAKSRLAFGLSSLAMSLLVFVLLTGMIPDAHRVQLRGRGALCESLAMSCSELAAANNWAAIRRVLDGVVRRTPDVRSAALLNEKGELAVEAGGHQNWPVDESSSESRVQVPIFHGESAWGVMQVQFAVRSRSQGPLAVFAHNWTRALCFFGAASFLVFRFYLMIMLAHLDPSQAIPDRVRSALDNLTEGIVVLDRRGRIVLANRAFAALAEREPNRLQGAKMNALPFRCDGEAPWNEALRQGEGREGAKVAMQNLAGEQRTMMVNVAIVWGADGAARGVLASLEDITDLERNKRELEEAKEAAELANRTKSDFLANMSHEIRTPMNAVLGFTDLIRRGLVLDEGERQDHLDIIYSSGEHLLNLINDILDLSKVEAGRLEVERTETRPHRLIPEVAKVLKVRADEKDIALRVRSQGPIPERILSDPARLRQVLTNLVGNAVKFTDEGAVEVVAQFRQEAGQGVLVVDVLDTGTGMSPQALQSIFNPFVQADASVTRKYGGTGLGLAISRKFAIAMGGSLDVTSQLGVGSVFRLQVPTGPVEDVPLYPLDESSPSATSERIDGRLVQLPGKRILVVDDSAPNRKLIRLVLQRAGAVSAMAENGRQAVEAVAASGDEPFDIILMDMQMPVMDGYQATGVLRERGCDTPIIALTANAMKGDEDKCREAGCTGFIPKPVNIDLLLETLAAALGLSGDKAPPVLPSPPPQNSPAGGPPPDDGQQPLLSELPADDPEFAEIICEFAASLQARFQEMEEAVAAGDEPALREHLHWLKGSGGTAGFPQLTEFAEQWRAALARDGMGVNRSCCQRLRGMMERMETPLAVAAGCG